MGLVMVVVMGLVMVVVVMGLVMVVVMALVIIVVVMVAAPPWIRLTGDDVDDRQR